MQAPGLLPGLRPDREPLHARPRRSGRRKSGSGRSSSWTGSAASSARAASGSSREVTKTARARRLRARHPFRDRRFRGELVRNGYSGNLVDLCPVGAITDTDFRFKTRAWFLEPSRLDLPALRPGLQHRHRLSSRFPPGPGSRQGLPDPAAARTTTVNGPLDLRLRPVRLSSLGSPAGADGSSGTREARRGRAEPGTRPSTSSPPKIRALRDTGKGRTGSRSSCTPA